MSGTRHTVESERRITFPGFAEPLDADYDAQTVHAFVEAAWRVETGAGTTVAPFLNLARVRTETDAFTETGGAAALSVHGRVQAANLATAGIGFSRSHDQGEGRSAVVSARLGWRQVWGDTAGDGRHAFAGGPAFAVRGLPLAKEAVVAELGLEVALKDQLSVTVDWSGQQSADLQAHALAASLTGSSDRLRLRRGLGLLPMPGRFDGRPRASRLVDAWVRMIDLTPGAHGTHSLRRTRVALICKKTGNLRLPAAPGSRHAGKHGPIPRHRGRRRIGDFRADRLPDGGGSVGRRTHPTSFTGGSPDFEIGR